MVEKLEITVKDVEKSKSLFKSVKEVHISLKTS